MKSVVRAELLCFLTVFASAVNCALAAANSNFISSPIELQRRIKTELHVTKPDFVVFVPAVTDTNVTDTGNEHFLVFDEPKLFMDHHGVSLGKPGSAGRLDMALYSSFTVVNGKPVLWYPDRKFFLLGRVVRL